YLLTVIYEILHRKVVQLPDKNNPAIKQIENLLYGREPGARKTGTGWGEFVRRTGEGWFQAHGLDLASSAARTVFCISIAIVIGPTPPGFGVIMPATGWTRAKSTSPTSRAPPLASGSRTRLTATSTTTAPDFTMSAFP